MSKLIEFFKKYQIIIFLAFIAGFLIILRQLILPEVDEVDLVETTPTPQLSPTPSEVYPTIPPEETPPPEEVKEIGVEKEEFMREILSNFPLSPYLPYPDQNIRIRYTDPLVLEIAKEGEFTDQEKEEILQWIRDQGIDPDAHQINCEER